MKFFWAFCSIILFCFNQYNFCQEKPKTNMHGFFIPPSSDQSSSTSQYIDLYTLNSDSNKLDKGNIDVVGQVLNQTFFGSAIYTLGKLIGIKVKNNQNKTLETTNKLLPSWEPMVLPKLPAEKIIDYEYEKKEPINEVNDCKWSSYSSEKPDGRNWDSNTKNEIFKKYKLYRHEYFRDFLCTLDHGPRFEELYRTIMKNPKIEEIGDKGDFSIKEFALTRMIKYQQLGKYQTFSSETQPQIIEDYKKARRF